MGLKKATIIDGKEFSSRTNQSLLPYVELIVEKIGRPPALAVILVGEDAASLVYVRNKVKQTKDAGMVSIEHQLSAETSEKTLLSLIDTLNKDDQIDGILVQLPLPDHINENSIINAIKPSKDVDGFSIPNVGLLSTSVSGLIPCTPLGCLLLLKSYVGDLSGKSAVIIGRSNIVGKPMAQLLLNENCTVTIAHSKTKNIEAVCKEADILVAAVGRPNFVKSEWVKKGAVVIDVGINRLPPEGDKKGRLVGDVDFNSVSNVASAITPVPGGVGPMTIACLLRNTVTAACKRRNFNEPEM